MTPKQKIERARELLIWCEGDDGLFAMISALRRKTVEGMLATEPHQADIREGQYHKIKALDAVRDELEAVLREGNNAAVTLKSEAESTAKGSKYY